MSEKEIENKIVLDTILLPLEIALSTLRNKYKFFSNNERFLNTSIGNTTEIEFYMDLLFTKADKNQRVSNLSKENIFLPLMKEYVESENFILPTSEIEKELNILKVHKCSINVGVAICLLVKEPVLEISRKFDHSNLATVICSKTTTNRLQGRSLISNYISNPEHCHLRNMIKNYFEKLNPNRIVSKSTFWFPHYIERWNHNPATVSDMFTTRIEFLESLLNFLREKGEDVESIRLQALKLLGGVDALSFNTIAPNLKVSFNND